MKFQLYAKIFFTLAAFLILPHICHAQMNKSVGIGEAIIENKDMVAAYKTALDEALIDAIREYLEMNSDNTTILDITPEYLKFIKSYKVTSRTADEYKISISVEVALDTVTINDASRFINKRLDTAVFIFKTSPVVTSNAEIGSIINKTLQLNNFSTMDQSNFSYLITDINDVAQVTNAFSSINGKFMFKFDFTIKEPDATITENVCEVDTTTEIKIKRGEEKALKITTSSLNKDKNKCISEAVAQAVNMTIDYVRTNIIPEEPQNAQVHSYEIQIINYKNMVSTNKFMATLIQKGFINAHKASAFASKEIIFKVESIFDPAGLQQKIREAGLDSAIAVTVQGNGLTLDFTLN